MKQVHVYTSLLFYCLQDFDSWLGIQFVHNSATRYCVATALMSTRVLEFFTNHAILVLNDGAAFSAHAQ